jgi:hypothetical protein
MSHRRATWPGPTIGRSWRWRRATRSPRGPCRRWSPKFATWSLGGGRPFGCAADKCERWHAGIDLTNAPDGALIIAPEDALVVGIDRGWSEGSKAAFLRTNTGLFLVLGGFKQGSHKEYGISSGQQVRKGDKLGRVLGSYGMIHLETYDGREPHRQLRVVEDEPPPEGLLNPTNYVERMVGDKVSLLQTRQRHEALQGPRLLQGRRRGPWTAASERRCGRADLPRASPSTGSGARRPRTRSSGRSPSGRAAPRRVRRRRGRRGVAGGARTPSARSAGSAGW